MIQDWFLDGKFGIFIHWGIYSVDGTDASWAFYSHGLPYESYMKQMEGFTAQQYDPVEWAQLFKKAGARYAVLTAKHHDGVCLFNTQFSDLNVVKKSPAGKDLIGTYCEAMQTAGLKTGIYFSHADWSHPYYPSLIPADFTNHTQRFPDSVRYTTPADKKDHPEIWEKFLGVHRGQLQEILTNYGTVDLLWFDGDWDRTQEQWDMKGLREYLHRLNPEIILNSRMGSYGDYATPEQGFPVIAPDEPWEFCMTMNEYWGYVPQDNHYKSLRFLLRTLIECVSQGGNLLLNISPKADGTIPEHQRELLLQMGEWIHAHSAAIYETRRGIGTSYFLGGSTISKDQRKLYLFLYDRPYEDICVKGLITAVKSIRVLSNGHTLSYSHTGNVPWMDMAGTLWITVPEEEIESLFTVIEIILDEPLRLSQSRGNIITLN